VITLQEWSRAEDLELTAAQVETLANTDRFVLRPQPGTSQRWRLSATSYVGVARIGELQLKVVPKVGVHRLLELLCTSLDRISWDDQEVALGESDDLLRIVAESFTRRAEQVVRRGVLQGYRSVEESMFGLRGRIDMGRQLSRRYGLLLPVEVTYDDYTIDVIENQLLLGAGMVLLRMGDLPTGVASRLRRLEVQLDGVRPTPPSPFPPRVAWTRLNERYRPATTLARLILKSSSLDIEGNPTSSSDAFLVDMNKVFEDVVGLGLQKVLEGTGMRVLLQHTDHLDYHRCVEIRPDIVVRDTSGSVAAVADIKYKRPSTDKLSPGDVYQAVAYATRYGLDRVFLIFAEPPPVPELQVGDITVRLLSVDLSATAFERERALTAIAQEWLLPIAQSLSPRGARELASAPTSRRQTAARR
jgi:5-methylcytosine-specific restriction enzyme subunit McrC